MKFIVIGCGKKMSNLKIQVEKLNERVPKDLPIL